MCANNVPTIPFMSINLIHGHIASVHFCFDKKKYHMIFATIHWNFMTIIPYTTVVRK